MRSFLCSVLVVMAAVVSAAAIDEPKVNVTESDGIYRVAATFTVPQTPAAAIAVLTDFERIPKYVPDMKTSTILERNEHGTVVEQEAIAKFMMFTKRVHLILHVSEDGGTIKFRDRCGKSFALYEGAWTVAPAAHGSTITYQLAAKPSFDVPGFVLKRLMKRDAADLIASITGEINARSGTR